MAKAEIAEQAEAILEVAGAQPPRPSELAERRQQLLATLASATEADVWLWTLQQVEPRSLETALLGVIDEGWSQPAQRLGWLDGTFSPAFRELLEPVRGRLGEHVTFTRSELLDDEGWYKSEFYRRYREPHGLDDLMLSLRPLEGELYSAIRLHRFHGRPHFGAAERELLHRVVAGCAWLDHVPLPSAGPHRATSLSPRERQVLLLLLEGGSKKQIADQLDLSFHTVNSYTRELYLHFGVRSRAELMARFVSPGVLADAMH